MAEWMEELRKLEGLRADSLITEEEFEKQKALLIPSQSNVTTYNLLGLGKGVSILSGLSAVLGLLTLIAFAYRASLLSDIKNGEYVSWSDADAADAFAGATVVFQWLIGIALLVLLIIWGWRAAGNIESKGRSGRWSRGWAIGGWFTPIMFFFVPYQVISDTWKKASDDVMTEGNRNNFWLTGFIFWWVSTVLSWLGSMAFNSYDTYSSLDDAITGDTLYAISGFFSIVAGIFIAIAFNQMSKRHTQ